MLIVCPNCETSYDVAPAALGVAGRSVRCVRCRETWHAKIDDMARADELVAAAEDIGVPADSARAAPAEAEAADSGEPLVEPPHIDSPPLAADAPPIEIDHEQVSEREPSRIQKKPSIRRRMSLRRRFSFGSRPSSLVARLHMSPPIAVAALAALCLAVIIWRNDVVRLMPQTGSFFKMAGLTVNLRNLNIEGVRVTSETVNGSRVFVIEGDITAKARKPVEIPRLRFVVQDERGADIYAWNTVVDQAVIQPGEKVSFRSRLASPPADAHSIIVRFFHRRDLASGSV